MTDIITKRCTKCGEEFPATSEYFQIDKSVKSGLKARCKYCIAEYQRLYCKAHPEKYRESSQRYKKKHPEKYREYSRRHRMNHPERAREAVRISRRRRIEKNPEAEREKSRNYARSNPERIAAIRQRYRKTHPDKVNEIHRRWRKNNPDKIRVKRANRRIAEINAEGTHTAADIQAQLKRQKGRCYYAACSHCKLGDTYHVEHVVPLARDGWNDPSNIVISCPSCNLHKHTKLPHEWPEGGRLL